ncbi:MAG: LCP family protein [Candidatus Saccharimonadales bacterium]
MPYKKSRNSKSSKPATSPVGPRAAYPARPKQSSWVAQQQAAEFPGIGITLGSYKHDPFKTAHQTRRTKAPKRPPGRFRQALTLKRFGWFMIIIVAAIGLWLGGKFIYNANRLFHGNILSVLTTTKLKGEENGRVNILLAGNSADDSGHSGADLTDSIMLMSIDTRNNQAFLMSIPRDLYVQLPGSSSHSKINYAYVAGEQNDFNQNGYPAGGMGELEKVIAENFGISINYYALVNYSALKEAVDAVGGVDITINSSDPRGLYDPNIDYSTNTPLVKLSNGTHHLAGQQALNLARARGDSYNSYGFAASDFERTKNQRNLLLALKTKAVTAGVLSNPAKLSSLSDAIGRNVTTDFSLSEVRRLYELVKNIDGGAIKSYSLNSVNGKNLLASYASPDGQSTLIPAAGLDDYSDISNFLQRITSRNPIVQEGAQIVILNGSDTAGLAGQQQARLEVKNYIVSDIGNATTQPATTIIQTKPGVNPNTLKALKALYGKSATITNTNPFADAYDADFIIILGTDQVPAASKTSQ